MLMLGQIPASTPMRSVFESVPYEVLLQDVSKLGIESMCFQRRTFWLFCSSAVHDHLYARYGCMSRLQDVSVS